MEIIKYINPINHTYLTKENNNIHKKINYYLEEKLNNQNKELALIKSNASLLLCSEKYRFLTSL